MKSRQCKSFRIRRHFTRGIWPVASQAEMHDRNDQCPSRLEEHPPATQLFARKVSTVLKLRRARAPLVRRSPAKAANDGRIEPHGAAIAHRSRWLHQHHFVSRGARRQNDRFSNLELACARQGRDSDRQRSARAPHLDSLARGSALRPPICT